MLSDFISQAEGSPVVDDASRAVVDEALASLGALRTQQWLGDGAGQVHLLASLRQEIDRALGHAVELARDQDCTWSEIATILGTTANAARRRYFKQPEGAPG